MAAGKKQFIFFHIIGILIFLCLPVLFLSNGPESKSIAAIAGNYWFWIFSIIYIAIFYLNAYWLFPGFYLKKHYLFYGIALLVLLLIIYFVQPFDHIISLSPPPNQPPGNFNNYMPGPPAPAGNRPVDFVSLFLYAVVVALSILIPIVKQWQKTQQQFFIVQKDKINAELSSLKAQVNPHFLFNTLNNLYSLSLTGSDKTPESIMRLSNIMRYVTDEVYNDYVPLENEIQCISDFIELQKLRLSSKTTVEFYAATADSNLSVAPLILLPFVENIFKHGISNNENNIVTIKIAVNQKELLFYSRNNIFNTAKNEHRQGTGIANVKKRLENLYAGEHFLKIEDDGKIFEVHLIINT